MQSCVVIVKQHGFAIEVRRFPSPFLLEQIVGLIAEKSSLCLLLFFLLELVESCELLLSGSLLLVSRQQTSELISRLRTGGFQFHCRLQLPNGLIHTAGTAQNDSKIVMSFIAGGVHFECALQHRYCFIRMVRIFQRVTEYFQAFRIRWIAMRIVTQIWKGLLDSALVQQCLGEQKLSVCPAWIESQGFFVFHHRITIIPAMRVRRSQIVMQLCCIWVGCYRLLQERNGACIIAELRAGNS